MTTLAIQISVLVLATSNTPQAVFFYEGDLEHAARCEARVQRFQSEPLPTLYDWKWVLSGSSSCAYFDEQALCNDIATGHPDESEQIFGPRPARKLSPEAERELMAELDKFLGETDKSIGGRQTPDEAICSSDAEMKD